MYTSREHRFATDSASQNVRILKHDKHSEITIRATLGYELRRQTGEFLTLHDPWANLGCTRAFLVSSRGVQILVVANGRGPSRAHKRATIMLLFIRERKKKFIDL